MSRYFGWSWGLMVVMCLSAARGADESVLSELYGNGVHAFFAGDAAGAHEQFTAAIRAGTQDPRVYMFRGLADLQLGRDTEAQTDLEKGASLEAADVNGQFPVGKALERIQGPTRSLVERYRGGARMMAYEQAERTRLQRYHAVQDSSDAVVRHVDAVPLQLHETPGVSSQKPDAARGVEPAKMSQPPKTPAVNLPAVTQPMLPGTQTGKPAAAPAPVTKALDEGNPFINDPTETPSPAKPAPAPIPAAGDLGSSGPVPGSTPAAKAAVPPAAKGTGAPAAGDTGSLFGDEPAPAAKDATVTAPKANSAPAKTPPAKAPAPSVEDIFK